MSLKDKEKWDSKYGSTEYITGTEPVEWLAMHRGFLSGTGKKALDIAAGEGRNAVFAAEQGYDVLAVDVSEKGLAKANALAEKKGVRITTRLMDLDEADFSSLRFDLILCFNFLDRKLFPQIKQCLSPGGLLFYETFNVDYLKYSSFRREWVLEPNELLREFGDLRVLHYREVDKDETAFASLLARKPD